MIINYSQEFQPVSRPSSSRLWTLLKAGKVAVLFATTFAYYSLRAGIIIEPVEGKEKDLKDAIKKISNLLSSPIVTSVSAGGFVGSAVGFVLAAGLFIVAIISGATEADFTSFTPLPYYLVAVSIFVVGGMFFGGLGGGFLGMMYSYIASVLNIRHNSFGVIIAALLGGLIGEMAAVLLVIIAFAIVVFALFIMVFCSYGC